MDYLSVSELKYSKRFWNRLEASKKLVLTRSGRPGALMLEVSPENLERVVSAVCRSLFSEAVSAARIGSEEGPHQDEEIEREIQAARR